MTDDLLTTVKAALDDLVATINADGKYTTKELRRKADALCLVGERGEEWLRALLARCEAAEAERDAARAEADRTDAILRQLAKDGRLWIDQKDLLNARVRLVYEPEHQPEIAAALTALRERHAEDVEHAFAAGVTFTATCTDQMSAGLRKWPEYKATWARREP